VAKIRPGSPADAARQQRPALVCHAGARAVTPARDPHGILCCMEQPLSPAAGAPAAPSTRPARLTPEELGALALGADPQRMSLTRLYLGLEGRIPRRTYWLHGVLSLLLLGIVVNALLDIADVGTETTGKLVNLVFLWPLIAVSAKRQHDFNFSAWWALIHFVPGVGSLILLVADGSMPGTHGPNRFGVDPREALARARINSAH
jgi:uncharacterized membrane protein YhaH (DUF805 family)